MRPGGFIVLTLPDERPSNSLLIWIRRSLIALGVEKIVPAIMRLDPSRWDRLLYLTVIPTITAESAAEFLTDQGFSVDPVDPLPRNHLLQPGHSLVTAQFVTPNQEITE